MKSLLICDTTEEERRKIVEESLGFMGGCDDCMTGLSDMYDDYIYGIRELEEITMSFKAGFTAAMKGPQRTGCGQSPTAHCQNCSAPLFYPIRLSAGRVTAPFQLLMKVLAAFSSILLSPAFCAGSPY